MSENSQIAQTVRRERKRLHYTQEEFALRVGVSLSFLRKLEQGKSTLRLDKVNEVLAFLGYHVAVKKGADEN